MRSTVVHYPRVPVEHGQRVVLIDEEEIPGYAPEIVRIVGEACVAQAVQYGVRDTTGARLNDASVRQQYDSRDQETVERFIGSARRLHELGARFAVLPYPNSAYQARLTGFSRIGPVENMTRNDDTGVPEFTGGYYLNDVWVDPAFAGGPTRARQPYSIGPRLMHAALLASDAGEEDILVLDAMDGNEWANAWYRRMGFVESDVPTSRFTFGSQEVPQHYYVADSAGLVMRYLETQHPEL